MVIVLELLHLKIEVAVSEPCDVPDPLPFGPPLSKHSWRKICNDSGEPYCGGSLSLTQNLITPPPPKKVHMFQCPHCSMSDCRPSIYRFYCSIH